MNLNEERFLKDVADHKMTVIHESGLHRHVRFQVPGAICMHFDLITWPGYLCYCGDMGTYVFSRLSDMFEFFRTDREYANRNGRQLAINLGYWSEKLQAVDGQRQGGKAKEFCEEKFRRVVNEYRVGWMRAARNGGRHALTKDQRRDLWEAVDDDVLSVVDDEGGEQALSAASRFHWSPNSGGDNAYQFDDFWEHNFTEYTHRFVWCCYALAWGIKTYDESKIAEAA